MSKANGGGNDHYDPNEIQDALGAHFLGTWIDGKQGTGKERQDEPPRSYTSRTFVRSRAIEQIP